MKNYYILLIAILLVISCDIKKAATFDKSTSKNDTVRIANEELEYEVIIIDPGFNSWLISYGKPRNFYSQTYMEERNRFWVMQWNQNVTTGMRGNLFEMRIDYDPAIDYGYEVNYLLFNYLTYFQISNNIQLGGFGVRL